MRPRYASYAGAVLFWLLTAGAGAAGLELGLVDHSLMIGQDYLLAQQRPQGNFHLAYDWVEDQRPELKNPAPRQAQALWGLAQLYRHQPGPALGAALRRGLRYVERHSSGPDELRYVNYPDLEFHFTGVQSVVTLALIDYLSVAAPDSEGYGDFRRMLEGYLGGLLRQQAGGVYWLKGYHGKHNSPDGNHTPYSDGPALLAMLRAALRLGYSGLRPAALAAAEAGYAYHVRDALARDRASKNTRYYFLWAVLSYQELAAAGVPGPWAERVFELADWMIDERRVLNYKTNAAHIYEGIAAAYALARAAGDAPRADKYAQVLHWGLGKLIGWQVGSRLQNDFILAHDPRSRPAAIGGVQQRADRPLLLTQLSQPFLHALLLTREYLLAGGRSSSAGG